MELLITALLVFARIFSVVAVAPVLGHHAVTWRMRLGIAVAVMLLAVPMVQPPEGLVDVRTSEVASNEFAEAKLNTDRFSQCLISELVIGLAMGVGVSIMFASATAAGSVIARMAGMQLGNQPGSSVGDSDGSDPVSRLFAVLSLGAFALMGGPALVLSAILETFIHLPPGVAIDSMALPPLLAQLLQQSFMLTLRAVGPVVASLLASNLVMGFLAQAWPQMNLSSLGPVANMAVMMFSISLTVGGTVWLLVDDVEPTIELMEQGLQDAAHIPTARRMDPVGAVGMPSEFMQSERLR